MMDMKGYIGNDSWGGVHGTGCGLDMVECTLKGPIVSGDPCCWIG
jgi:hypothetical protein